MADRTMTRTRAGSENYFLITLNSLTCKKFSILSDKLAIISVRHVRKQDDVELWVILLGRERLGYIKWFFVVFGPLLMLATQISPETATSNLSAWAQYLGLDKAAELLAAPSVDSWGMTIGVILTITIVVSIFLNNQIKRQDKMVASSNEVPIDKSKQRKQPIITGIERKSDEDAKNEEYVDSFDYFAEIKSKGIAPSFNVSLNSDSAGFGGYERVYSITVQNSEDVDLQDCTVQLEKINGLRPVELSLPMVLRTDDQIRGNENGRFLLSSKQHKVIPVLFRRATRKNDWYLIDEYGVEYYLPAEESDMTIGVYGGRFNTKHVVSINSRPKNGGG